MQSFLRKWFTISFFNFLLVAALGVLLRYKILFYLPFVHQKNVLHSHSHFAFAGWVTQILMVLLVHHLYIIKEEQVFKKYQRLLYANLIAAYGMLISFVMQRYGLFSISFSTLSIIFSYLFVWYYWKDLNSFPERRVSTLWFKAALLFYVISSIGPWVLAYMMMNKISDQHYYLATIFFFLHFQYNGWFLFSCMGLLVVTLEQCIKSTDNLKIVFPLFCFACIPAYFLSVMWFSLSSFVYLIIILAIIAQLAGWAIMIRIFIQNKSLIRKQFSTCSKLLLFFSGLAFSIKLLLQTISVHPALSKLSYSFRPIVIGYLHLNLLAVTSIFILGYIAAHNLITVTRKLESGIYIFTAGVIINECLLMLQGVAALNYNSIPFINAMLLLAALILFSGIGILLIGVLEGCKTRGQAIGGNLLITGGHRNKS